MTAGATIVRVLLASASYFAMVFGTGFVLGLIRVPLLVPRLGERVAELLEMPVILVVMFFASRYVSRRFALTTSPGLAASVGGLALLMLLGAELLLVVTLTRDSIAEYIAGRDPVSGVAYVASLLVFAAMPWLQQRRAGLELD